METSAIAQDPTIDPEVAAAAWHARLSDDADTRIESEFRLWRDASPAHRAAYERIAAKQDDLRTFARTPEILALRHQTLVRLTMKRRADESRRAAVGIALLMLLLVGLPGGIWLARSPFVASSQDQQADAGKLFQTAKGQRLALTLADGSRVTLNTASRVRIAYNNRERRLALESGQAWFEVAKNQSRPFIVQAGRERIEAHGTAFDVRLLPDRTEVMLAEGRVTVASARALSGPASVNMSPNQLLVASNAGLRSQKVESSSAWSNWRRGVVAFDNTPLSQATAEMNRYSDKQLQLADASTGRIVVSGTFIAGETDAFVEALALGFKVRASKQGDDKVLLKAAP